jgi:hypothetical protein
VADDIVTTNDNISQMSSNADDIVTRLRADGVYGPTDKTLPLSREAADEIERLRRLCSHMATLLDDCRPADATLVWVMARLDTLEEWQAYRSERGL